MKKITTLAIVCFMALMSNAMPARPGFRTVVQSDGTTIEVQKMGDEFYHYTVNREGQEVKLNKNGMYEVVGEAPSIDVVKARRANAKVRRAKVDVGTEPYPAPRGLLILANFSDKSFKSTNTKAVMDSLINAKNCQVNNGYGSAAQYFRDQSNGQYAPVFDVVGPVTLSKGWKYYGENDADGNDNFATDAVIEACKLADSQVDFTEYNWNGDQYVDFVYVIYAGYGEADTDETTNNSYLIWPHNYSIQEIIKYGSPYTIYSKADTKVDGLYLDNYAMSQELDGYSGSRAGNGTFCHEFGHVIGLPDFYDTGYGTNYKNGLTPNDWDIMDGGGYNKDGHCPPNYSAWEKYFMGWVTPINLGSEGAKLELKANGTDGYQCYQINTSGNLEASTKEGLNYYIENRQLTGWDVGLPSHGLLIWKVNFSSSAWKNNSPNNTANNPRYTVLSASGTGIGTHVNSAGSAYIYDGPKNVYPGEAKVTEKEVVTGKPLKGIKESNGVISLVYIDEPAGDPFDLVWMSNGEEFAVTTSTGKVALPAGQPASCNSKVFVGWCRTENYSSDVAPAFVEAGESAAEGDIFYAVFATKESAGGAAETKTYVFTDKAWSDATSSWKSNKDGVKFDTDKDGVQVTATGSGAGAVTKNSLEDVSKVVVTYCTNSAKGEGSVAVKAGSTVKSLDVTKSGGTTLRDLTYNFDKESGKVEFEVTCSTNSIYIHSVAVTCGGSSVSYSGYTTTLDCGQGIEDVVSGKQAAIKTIRDGQLVIIRGDEVFTVTGVRIQ